MFVLLACVVAGCGVHVDLPAGRKKLVAPLALLVLGVIVSLYAPIMAPAADSRVTKVVEVVQAGSSGSALMTLSVSLALGPGRVGTSWACALRGVSGSWQPSFHLLSALLDTGLH